MIYSCFDQKSGLYRYFEGPEQVPINGDLPVPNYLKSRQTKLGAPALEAGRPLPSQAKPVGKGLNARGMIVNCESPGPAFSGMPETTKTALIVGGALGTAALLWYTDQRLSALAIGGITIAGLLAG